MNFQTDELDFSNASCRAERICAKCKIVGCPFARRVARSGTLAQHRLTRGQGIQCPDGACLRFWIVIEGYAATCTYFRDGRRQILSIDEPGTAVCGLMVAEDSEQRLEALTDCLVCEVDLTEQALELRNDAEFLADVSRMLHERLERSIVHVSMLGRLDSFERVTYFLADMATRHGRKGAPVTLSMSREDIADYLGLNTDSVSRILTRIRKAGLVRFVSPTEYFVPDMKAVARRLPVAAPTPARSMLATGGHVQ
ncbi:Crp/Fnr family transcriptional regulator [Ovoidimarina sediminis]|uniref:Crp/Fnr family transcriptional regulator n=1 Tax=Ovoidimarina sediminis TaxID=3079856 RepID=UPI00290AAB62|nr:Crp/Fnr family transcriptional regulator [Rhodophyticola sp. MJ-SS7]MDU8946735.1 Crp/Fnr family transcriptional regulator [Rhodophyticola sp. MJ-SS7]